MKTTPLFIIALLMLLSNATSQSLELMPGTERIFVDAQWFSTFDEDRKWSLFSRSRATTDYDENTNLFTGAYLNYTLKSGIGGTILGRISNAGAGSDVGIHLFKANGTWMIYALAFIGLSGDLSYGWFSILRYTPAINDNWLLYTSLELFSNFGESGHVASVQRMRVGLSRGGYQFGFGLNLSGIGQSYNQTDSNPGVFIRKQF
ncbi:MAG: hypothetical protein R8G66_08770 [Cytophagales bacterium]|nr:hypothetical protein [Cytophagales bacterium]